jgi:translation initiation factor 2 alpha subunit (eIF-2alpha)
VQVSADNWKRAEEILEKVSENVVTNITNAGGQGEFRREK